jgi:flagellar biosynthesis/type III secretory pathway chaperone
MLSPFISTLEELITIHVQLVQTAERKKSILVQGDIDALSKLIQEESKLVRQLGKLEEERMFQMNQYLAGKGIQAEEMTLTQFLSVIPSSVEREEVRILAEKLQSAVSKLKENNELNGKLIQDSLNYVNHSIELLTDSNDPMTYKSPTKKLNQPPSTPGRSFFDTKA